MEDFSLNISVILPVHNEEENLAQIIERIKKVGKNFEVIVVNDGSTDGSLEIAKNSGVKVVSHPYNRGNGAAVKTGVITATRDIVLLMDADGQHPPEEIPKLIEYIHGYDMVIAARGRHADVSKVRSVGNLMLKKIAEFLTGFKIPDLTSGFRVIKRDKFLDVMHLLPEGYSYPTTITIAFVKSGNFIKYVTLDTIGKRKRGISNIRPFKDGMRFIKIILRIIMLFDPQKIFFPISLFLISLGSVFALYTLIRFASIRNFSVTMIITGVFTFLFGLLAEQISLLRRDIKRYGRE